MPLILGANKLGYEQKMQKKCVNYVTLALQARLSCPTHLAGYPLWRFGRLDGCGDMLNSGQTAICAWPHASTSWRSSTVQGGMPSSPRAVPRPCSRHRSYIALCAVILRDIHCGETIL